MRWVERSEGESRGPMDGGKFHSQAIRCGRKSNALGFEHNRKYYIGGWGSEWDPRPKTCHRVHHQGQLVLCDLN